MLVSTVEKLGDAWVPDEPPADDVPEDDGLVEDEDGLLDDPLELLPEADGVDELLPEADGVLDDEDGELDDAPEEPVELLSAADGVLDEEDCATASVDSAKSTAAVMMLKVLGMERASCWWKELRFNRASAVPMAPTGGPVIAVRATRPRRATRPLLLLTKSRS